MDMINRAIAEIEIYRREEEACFLWSCARASQFQFFLNSSLLKLIIVFVRY